ncbi:MAG: YgfZ/GcvT domain-containing protein [Bacteroidota bacterium]
MQNVDPLISGGSIGFDPSFSKEHNCSSIDAAQYPIPLIVFSLTGNDIKDLFQRISTNDVVHLKTGEYRSTIFLTEKGKFVDLITLIVLDERILLISETLDSNKIKHWIEKFIIMDDVQIQDVSSEYTSFALLGDNISEFIKDRFAILEDSLNSKEHYHSISGGYLIKNALWSIPSYVMMLTDTTHNSLSLPFIDERSFELIRIECVIPKVGKELNEDTNPLEANLNHLINFKKGCYVGQEVIAKIDTIVLCKNSLKNFASKPRTNQ